MSLVSTYLRASDGKLYKEPVYRKVGDWFICFDDEEPIELVIRLNSPEGDVCGSARDVPVVDPCEVLAEVGLVGVTLGEVVHPAHGRVFAERGEGWVFKPARSWWLEAAPGAVFPPPHEHEGARTKAPRGDCVIYGQEVK